VQRVVPLADVDTEVDRVAPVSPEVRELTSSTIARVRGSDEAREGFAAFLAKRPAKWIPE
jgi:methylglutaconyl-CoA hydratase